MIPEQILNGAKILIVDDIQDNIKILGTLLRRYNVKISIAQNGLQAIKVAESVLPDLILMDVNMPEMDGFEAASNISKNETTKDIPILFLTALSEINDVVKGFELGGVDYVTKPFETKVLLARVSAHLERKFSKEKITESNQKLQKANNDKDKFLSMVAHDLRSPFSGILGLIKILDEDKDNLDKEESDQFISALHEALKSQYAFLENLLSWGRLQLDSAKINKDDFHIIENFNSVQDVLGLNAKSKNIELVIKVEPEDLQTYGDQNQLYSVLHNLTSNALKFTKEGGTITMSAEKTESGVVIKVKDTGIGMPKEMADSIFALNKMRSRPGTNNEPGTGLGLVLCHEIVDKHGGKIWVESEENVGTTFLFELPFKEDN